MNPDSQKITDEVKALLDRFKQISLTIDPNCLAVERPIYGTTIYLATCHVEMTMGRFTAHVFQDIIHKGYVIALAYGDIHTSKQIYTRIHSSCVTGETLMACDCDCAQQLEGGLKRIASAGVGILFYLMQEGRGVGYVAKSRDRMLVQSTEDQITTFEAYHLMGLNPDYRQYRNIKPICQLLGIDPEFILLTNNPEKISHLKNIGVNVAKSERIEVTPGPYNLAYLASKMVAGHMLVQPQQGTVPLKLPEKVVPFKPHVVKNAQRFVYVSSYLLPILPVDDEIILNQDDYYQYFDSQSIESYLKGNPPIIQSYQKLNDHRVSIKINRENLIKHRAQFPKDKVGELIYLPYWFRVHVYFDVVSGEDYVVLTYGNAEAYDVPIVRIQSDSIFNRFPLKDSDNREKFKLTIQSIVRHGCGALVLLYNDGRGAGFGAYAEDLMLRERGICNNTDESYKTLAITYDSRDYMAAMTLLKEHIPGNHVEMVMNSPNSLVKKIEYTQALHSHGIEVNKWIFLENLNFNK